MIPLFTTPSFWLLLLDVSSRAFAFRNGVVGYGVDFGKKCIDARSVLRKSISASTMCTTTSTMKLSMAESSDNININAALIELMEEADFGQDILDEVNYDATGMTTFVEQPVMFSNPKDEQNGFDFER